MLKPPIECSESIGAHLDLDHPIDAKHGDGQIASERSACRSRQWDSFGRETLTLEQSDKRAFGAVALVPRPSTAGLARSGTLIFRLRLRGDCAILRGLYIEIRLLGSAVASGRAFLFEHPSDAGQRATLRNDGIQNQF